MGRHNRNPRDYSHLIHLFIARITHHYATRPNYKQKMPTRDGLRRILESKDRRASPGTAPASGLYLEKVYYLYDEMNQDAQELLVYE